MRRFMFLGLGGFLLLAAGILLCGAGPARADNGPHVAGANGGGFNKIVGADRCASCHRAHLDEGAAAVGTSLDGLCPTCHGPSALGSTTDVVDGVGYAADVTPGRSQGTGPGALRLGGFSYAHIGSGTATKDTYFQGPTLLARNQDIPVLAASQATTSSHRVAGLPVTVTATGTGATGSVTDALVMLTCVSCHDPHGNGAYRILRSNPDQGARTAAVGVTIPDASVKVYTTNNYWLSGDAGVPATLHGTDGTSGTDASSGTSGLDGTDGYVNNIARWCTTCHSQGHSATPTKMGRGTICITCHVAHGSNASMSGARPGQLMESDVLPAAGSRASSRLLRIDNGAACLMCHNG